ncbi:hypothetical protein [Burkholderia lata]|uniref:hypothetical protein n=1 Tax=Burkholderia lata (strain ATCC 17760 / DSM 23089 / LMG 22485 / NCIMB 9086 / R18194 / 383) TaxID=482957 RepID=UPI001582EAFA|nr:hypothetical protein [Burkholderia lata]
MSLIAMAQALGIPLQHRKRLETDRRSLSAAIQHQIEPAFCHSVHRSSSSQVRDVSLTHAWIRYEASEPSCRAWRSPKSLQDFAIRLSARLLERRDGHTPQAMKAPGADVPGLEKAGT